MEMYLFKIYFYVLMVGGTDLDKIRLAIGCQLLKLGDASLGVCYTILFSCIYIQ